MNASVRSEAGRVPSWSPAGGALPWRLGYIAVIALATISQLRVPAGAGEVVSRVERAFDPSLTGSDAVDAVRNLVLFAGWGVVWVVTAARLRWRTLLRDALVTGALLSAGVEAAQLLSPTRNTSVLDVLSNTAGAVAGAIAAIILLGLLVALRGRKSFVGVPALLFAAGYGGAAALEAFSPLLRQERYGDAWGAPSERFGIAFGRLDAATWLDFGLVDVLLFVPAGFFAVAALVEFGWTYRRSAVVVAIAGLFASGLLELARGAVGFVLAYGPILAHGIGIAAGGALAAWAVPHLTRLARGRVRPLALLIAYAALLLLWAGRPFYLEPSFAAIGDKLTLDRLIPLQAYRERFDLHTAADAAIPALLFLPVGALLAVWPLRRSGTLRGLLPAVALAIVAESLQLVMAARTFDITDVLIAASALAVGWVLTRRAGYRA
ncbi:MAG: VanZ family protein, partial [Longimicrobiales bacterium]